MNDLIEALQILLKYGNERWPTWCEHDCLNICGIDEKNVSEEDKLKLEELGFLINSEEGGFFSHRFGSA